jgi:hypothetical protein
MQVVVDQVEMTHIVVVDQAAEAMAEHLEVMELLIRVVAVVEVDKLLPVPLVAMVVRALSFFVTSVAKQPVVAL